MLNVKRSVDTERNVWQGAKYSIVRTGLGDGLEFETRQPDIKYNL
jgi:hypothetical protein